MEMGTGMGIVRVRIARSLLEVEALGILTGSPFPDQHPTSGQPPPFVPPINGQFLARS